MENPAPHSCKLLELEALWRISSELILQRNKPRPRRRWCKCVTFGNILISKLSSALNQLHVFESLSEALWTSISFPIRMGKYSTHRVVLGIMFFWPSAEAVKRAQWMLLLYYAYNVLCIQCSLCSLCIREVTRPRSHSWWKAVLLRKPYCQTWSPQQQS